MKKYQKILVVLMALLMLVPTIALAEEPPVEEPPEEEPILEEALPLLYDFFLEIPEESPLYPVKLLMESITFEIEVDEDGFMLLVISFEDESGLLTSEQIEDLTARLTEKIAKLLSHPVEEEVVPEEEPPVEETPGEEPIAEEEPPAEEPVEEETGITIVILLGSDLTEGQQELVLKLATKEVIKSFITESFFSVKEWFFEAKDLVTEARNDYKDIRKIGSDEDVMAAYDKLMEAREQAELMESLKAVLEELKDEIKDFVDSEDEEEAIEPEDEDEDAEDEEKAIEDEDGDADEDDEEDKEKEDKVEKVNPSTANKLKSNGLGGGLVK